MRRLAFGIILLSLLLAATVSPAATPGFTISERMLAGELQKRLLDRKGIKIPPDDAFAFARTYMRRAYVVDVEPAVHLAVELLTESGKGLPANDQLQCFAWALDALVRGATLADVQATIQGIFKEHVGAERMFYMEQLLGSADRYTSPVPLVQLAREIGNNGLVGRRRQDFMTWAAGLVRQGEDPAYMLQMYKSITKIVISVGAQSDQLKKFYGDIRRGVPPRALAETVLQLSGKYETNRLFDQDYDKIIGLYFGGAPFEDAVKKVMKPPKEPKEAAAKGL